MALDYIKEFCVPATLTGRRASHIALYDQPSQILVDLHYNAKKNAPQESGLAIALFEQPTHDLEQLRRQHD